MSAEPAATGAGARLDHYRLERRLAVGGMAEIYLATDARDGRPVAIKKVLPQIATDQAFLDRFFHEIRIQITLKHRNVVELLDCSPAPANCYIVMEYIDGGALHGLREQVGRFPWEVALFVVEESLKGLGAAHKKGIVHRDVKPQNIMWKRDGTVKIADFGISQADHLTRLTMTGMVVGTPAHMSPEQARGEEIDARSDIFSMGTVLYELLTGTNPFTAESVTSTLRKVVEVEPDPPSLLDPTVPPSVDVVLRKLHAKTREGRFATADEACEAIRAVLADEGVLHAGSVFRDFLRDPEQFVSARNARLAAESAALAKQLLEDRNAPPEKALWEAYRTISCAPQSSTAQNLFSTAAMRAGQRDKPLDNARIRELEAQLRKDPENVGILLQLAKLYRLEKDFLNVMRFFRRLQTVAPKDAYTQGQIAALVGGAVPSSRRARPPRARSVRHDAEPEPRGIGRALTVVGAVALLAVCLWWARRPAFDIRSASQADRERAEAVANLLKKATSVRAEEPARLAPEDDLLQKTLEKGALIEKEGGAEKAVAFYRSALPGARTPQKKAVLLMTIAETARKAGDRTAALQALDEAIEIGGEARATAMLLKGELLESAHEDAEARRLYEELAREPDQEVQIRATLRLALSWDRAGEAARALILYEAVIAKASAAADANIARLGAAELYRAAGRKADARRMYEDVQRSAPAGSSTATSAEQGLKKIEP